MQNKTLNEYLEQLKIYVQQSNYTDSIDLLKNAISQYPEENKLKLNLGNIYKLLDQNDDAANIFSTLKNTELADLANNNLSIIYLEQGDLDKSIEYAKVALGFNQDYSDAKFNLALAFFERKSYQDSLLQLDQLSEIDAYKSRAFELKIRIQQIICDWSSYTTTRDILYSNELVVHPFLHISHVDNEEKNFLNAKGWSGNTLRENKIVDLKTNKAPIKLGFLCGEIRNHPTFHLIKNLFKELNDKLFSLTMFSYNHEEYEKDYIESSIRFIDLTKMNRQDANNCIKTFDIDVLIDLTTIISHNRQNILDKNCAKVIISYLAFPGTTGSALYDYIITDNVVAPESQQKFYQEKFLALPSTYQVNDGNINVGVKEDRKSWNLPIHGTILGSLNQSFKLEPVMFDAWIDILQTHENTYLWLLDEGEDMRKNLLSYLDKRIDQKRIIFAERVDRERHLARIKNIDVALDTRIYNGHTTSIEMLQSGIPLVTLEGKHFASRVSTSLLHSLEIRELIAKDIDDYKKIVSTLINDNNALNSLKSKIQRQLSESKLMDTSFFARTFEDAILGVIK
ncbi:MAG: tetratricopeptide repeat protein [Pseudomonadota bacterium]|nr:tetratricopeptide repeat protein [Pseudomonadota bacterium]